MEIIWGLNPDFLTPCLFHAITKNQMYPIFKDSISFDFTDYDSQVFFEHWIIASGQNSLTYQPPSFLSTTKPSLKKKKCHPRIIRRITFFIANQKENK